jgi:hypothetical protein
MVGSRAKCIITTEVNQFKCLMGLMGGDSVCKILHLVRDAKSFNWHPSAAGVET